MTHKYNVEPTIGIFTAAPIEWENLSELFQEAYLENYPSVDVIYSEFLNLQGETYCIDVDFEPIRDDSRFQQFCRGGLWARADKAGYFWLIREVGEVFEVQQVREVKLYDILVFRHNRKTGENFNHESLGLQPMTHKEAMTVISKFTAYPDRGFTVKELG